MLDVLNYHSRDHSRVPMQWSAEKNTDFSTGTPWLKVNDSYQTINVADQENDPNSILNFYKAMIHFKKDSTQIP